MYKGDLFLPYFFGNHLHFIFLCVTIYMKLKRKEINKNDKFRNFETEYGNMVETFR